VRRLAWILLAAVVVVGQVGLVGLADDECYEDVNVSGPGFTEVGGIYEFNQMINGKPMYYLDTSDRPAIHWDQLQWVIWYLTGFQYFYVYINTADTPTPPSNGWEEYKSGIGQPPVLAGGEAMVCGCGDPTPTEIVAATVAATVAADPARFLDVVLEGEEPVMAGLLELAAIHTVGDAITGGGSSAFHLYLYSVDITTKPETVVLIAHRMASYDRETGVYEFSWDTTGMAPGYYDVRLSFGAVAYNFRIQLTVE
jgi:hypothetical protein